MRPDAGAGEIRPSQIAARAERGRFNAVPGPYRPPAPPVTVDTATGEGGDPTVPGGGSGHPAVDAALQALANAADLPSRDQIAEYEAAHRTLQETLATIDQN